MAESVDHFDEVNVATALHRLAKLQPPNNSGQQSPIVYAEQFKQLIAAIKRLLHRFEAQAVSNTMWGMSLMAHGLGSDALLLSIGVVKHHFWRACLRILWLGWLTTVVSFGSCELHAVSEKSCTAAACDCAAPRSAEPVVGLTPVVAMA